MPKGSFFDDTFEKLAELGVSTVKKTTQSVKQTFDPTSLLDKASGSETTPNDPNHPSNPNLPNNSKDKSHNPLNLEDLKKKYQDQDTQKTDALRNRLFQLVKSGEEKVIQEKDKEKKEKEQQLLYEEQEKKRKKEEQKRVEETQVAPKGKERKSIFGAKKKKAQANMAEIKPNVGKQ